MRRTVSLIIVTDFFMELLATIVKLKKGQVKQLADHLNQVESTNIITFVNENNKKGSPALNLEIRTMGKPKSRVRSTHIWNRHRCKVPIFAPKGKGWEKEYQLGHLLGERQHLFWSYRSIRWECNCLCCHVYNPLIKRIFSWKRD